MSMILHGLSDFYGNISCLSLLVLNLCSTGIGVGGGQQSVDRYLSNCNFEDVTKVWGECMIIKSEEELIRVPHI